jgi:UDP-glucose 4-epimerase
VKVVVTGALGFVGSNLFDLLIKEGHEVHGIDNLSSFSSHMNNMNPNGIYSIDDSSNSSAWPDGDIDVIFHLAADARIQPSFDDPFGTYQNNVISLAYAAAIALKKKAKLVFASTSSSLHGDYVSPYTQSKRASEEYLRTMAYCFGLDCSSARFFNVYGPREPIDGDYATVVAKFGRQYKNGEPMTVVGDGTQSRDFTHVNDICSGLLAITENKMNGEVVNLGRGNPYSIMDLVKMYAGESAKEGVDFKHVPKRKNEGQATKWFETVSLNWQPTINLPDYIDQLKKSWNND